jgi:hypothetical protein
MTAVHPPGAWRPQVQRANAEISASSVPRRPLIHAPDFLRHGALLIALLGFGLSWLAAGLLVRRRPLRGAARRGFYLGLGTVNGMALVAMVGITVAIL